MSHANRFVRFELSSVHRLTATLAAGAAVLLSGCSADIARFDYPPTFNLTEGQRTTTSSTTPPVGMSAPAATDSGIGGPEPAYRPSGNSIYTPQRVTPPTPGVQMSALPEPAAPAPLNSAPPPRRDLRAVRPAAASPPPARELEKGDVITVESGDTLYGLSRKHHVSISELMSVNGLTSPRIRPGQQLSLPATGGAVSAAPSARPHRTPVRPAAVAPAPDSGGAGTHTVQPGDSLYKIARQHGTTVASLKAANAISDPRALRPGTVLTLPGAGGATLAAAPPARAPANPPPAPLRPVSEPVSSVAAIAPAPPSGPAAGSVVPTIVNGTAAKVASAPATTVSDARPVVPPLPSVESKPVKVAEIRPDPAPSANAMPAMSGKLRWPAKGKVVANFGARADGSHNDGVNLAVPLGTDIHAAEGGVVAYAGNELKGYGNLVLIRHDNGWVTAYAHADQLLVKRGDKVRRGQVVAKAGKTGTVDQPQVHFELRMGSKPVDPLPYMEKS